MADQMTPERLAEIRDLNVDSCSADARYNADVWALEYARMDLLAEVDRLNRAVGRPSLTEAEELRDVMEKAAHTAFELGAGAGMDVLVGYMSDHGMLRGTVLPSEVQARLDSAKPGGE